MKNIFNYKFVAVVFSLGLLSSCNDEDTSYTKSVKSVVTTQQTSLTIAEGASAPVTLTLDKPYKEKCQLKIEIVGGTGSNDDFDTDGDQTITDDGWGLLGYKLEIPAYATSYTFNINAILDLLPEGTETLKLKLSSAGNGNALVDASSEFINVTITPTVSSDFYANFDWSGSYKDAHGTPVAGDYKGVDDKQHEYCDFDFDLEIYDAGFNLVDASYSSCPEELTLDGATTPDGDYIIVPSFWTRVVAATAVPKSGEIIYPAVLTMSKPGAFVHTVDMTGTFKYSVGGAVQNNPDAYVPVAVVTKTGNTYVLTDFNTAEVLAQGRMQAFINAIKSKKSKK
jgi:hypothetical protein